MTTMTDEEAIVLGSRAVNAGLRIVPGMKTLHARNKWSGGIVTGFDYDGSPAISTGLEAPFSPQNLTADLSDPGTKGHAVAQLRERTGNPLFAVTGERSKYPNTNDRDDLWWTSPATPEDQYDSEEEAIIAAFEAIKEAPAPYLDCPECCHPLIPANTRGRYRERTYVEHALTCRCGHCDWHWSEDNPVTCACGTVAQAAESDNGGAYAKIATPAPVEP